MGDAWAAHGAVRRLSQTALSCLGPIPNGCSQQAEEGRSGHSCLLEGACLCRLHAHRHWVDVYETSESGQRALARAKNPHATKTVHARDQGLLHQQPAMSRITPAKVQDLLQFAASSLQASCCLPAPGSLALQPLEPTQLQQQIRNTYYSLIGGRLHVGMSADSGDERDAAAR